MFLFLFFNCFFFLEKKKKFNFFVAVSEDEGASFLPSADPLEKSSPFSYFFRPQGVSHQTLMPVSSSLNTCLIQLMVSFYLNSYIKINHFVFSSVYTNLYIYKKGLAIYHLVTNCDFSLNIFFFFFTN